MGEGTAIDDTDLQLDLPAQARAAAAASYARSGILRIPELFPDHVANALHHHFETEIDWNRVFNQAGDAWDVSPEVIATMDRGEVTELTKAIHQSARDGFQFLFDSLIVSDDPADRKARGLLLDRVVDALNHPASLEILRGITGESAIRMVDGQATRYLPGHFLTSHDDGIDGEGRVAAFVINLTRDWRSDWGGLLQFHNSAGDIPLGLKPGFNTIHLFRVPQVHSVSFVAPYAAAPRYAITGWLRR
jgi:Rps23 Pro-64 3,4-dihydroxylase Tpa1-like proline 4-hydroxylase